MIFFFLSLVVISIYSNTFHASWHLDDSPNILNNYFLHINSLSFDKLLNTLYTDVHAPYQLNDRMYRPIPCLTFALNWYFGQDNVFGYHVVNISIHILTAFFLFLFIINLFHTPNLRIHLRTNPIMISLLASLLWAVNPIQTQAVTYIVQRMAQLAALFYIIGMYAYIRGRLSKSFVKRTTWFLMVILLYPLAIYSKSNAVMLPLAVLLVEVIFFQNAMDIQSNKRTGMIALFIAGFIILFGSFVFLKGNLLSVLNGYESRSFTLTERLLAEPRVIVFYLSQIFYPSPDRFSIAHDIILSSSFIKPWTTIPCILLIFSMIGVALSQIKKNPLLSFAILFFFLNHIIESSVIPLEIIFEHRNYLPSFFLFLPIIYVLYQTVLNSWDKNRATSFISIFLILFMILYSSISTYDRNKAWVNDITLWTDAMSKAPNDARGPSIIAIKLAWGKESIHPRRYDMALKLFEDSLDKFIPSKSYKADILGNMASIHFYNKRNQQKAILLYEDALEISPNNLKIRKDLVNALIIMKNFKSAEQHVNILIDRNNKNGAYYNLKGHILLWENNYPEALSYFEKAYQLIPGKPENKINIILNTSVALTLSGDYEKAEFLLLEAINLVSDISMTCSFALIENSIRAKDDIKTQKYTKKLFDRFDKEQIEDGLENFTDNPKLAPISKKLILPVIEKMM